MKNDLHAAIGTLERRKHYLSECMKESNNPWAETNQTEIDALAVAISALRDVLQRQPDPITGLVPCGCGGKAETHELYGDFSGINMTDCKKCATGTTQYLTKKEAQDAWNTAMGWKGGAE